jgi:hypothetical protein
MRKLRYKQQTLFDKQTMADMKKKPVEAPKVPVDESDIKTETVHTIWGVMYSNPALDACLRDGGYNSLEDFLTGKPAKVSCRKKNGEDAK